MSSNLTIGKQNAIEHIIALMHEYQKQNNIEKQCITNSQYLFDSIKASFPTLEVKVRAIMAYQCVENQPRKNVDGIIRKFVDDIIIIHMCVDIGNGKLYDPSYEISSLPDIDYIAYDVIPFLKSLTDRGATKEQVKELVAQYVKFIKIAEKMNAGIPLVEKKYYHAQADYIESNFKN